MIIFPLDVKFSPITVCRLFVRCTHCISLELVWEMMHHSIFWKLESNSTIVDLDLNTNYMDDVGEALEKFLTTMTTTTTVTDTTLATTITTKNTYRRHLQRLNLSYNWITEWSTHGMGRGWRHNQQLVELKLHGCLFVRELDI